jgi:hypothetical protein
MSVKAVFFLGAKLFVKTGSSEILSTISYRTWQSFESHPTLTFFALFYLQDFCSQSNLADLLILSCLTDSGFFSNLSYLVFHIQSYPKRMSLTWVELDNIPISFLTTKFWLFQHPILPAFLTNFCLF